MYDEWDKEKERVNSPIKCIECNEARTIRALQFAVCLCAKVIERLFIKVFFLYIV